MNELLPCVEIEPPAAEAVGTVLWLHGLGASGHDFEPIVPYLGLPRVRFVFPHAPSRPVTINMGMIMPSWYDVTGIGTGGVNEAHIRESAAHVDALIARERERGIPSTAVVLAGFSQGGAMALHVGLRHPEPLNGIVVLSAYEHLPETRAAEQSAANRATPMLFCHGTHDPLVPFERGRRAYESCSSPDRDTEWHPFPIAHEVSMPEIEVIGGWLRRRFAEAASPTTPA